MPKIDMPMGNKSFHLIHIWPIGQGLLFCSFVFVRKGILSVWSEECSWKTCSTLEKGNRRESALINETTEARNKRVKLASISCYCTVYFCMFLCNTVFCAAKCFWKNCVPAWRMLSSSIRSSLDQFFPQNPLNDQNAPASWLLPSIHMMAYLCRNSYLLPLSNLSLDPWRPKYSHSSLSDYIL